MPRKRNFFKHTAIYTHYQRDDQGNPQELDFVRLVPTETKRFPHGISLATTFPRAERSKTEEFAQAVDQYLDDFLETRKVSDASAAFRALTDEQRLELMGSCCKYCGTLDPDCHCWNDE